MRKEVCGILPFLLALVLRLYPTVMSGLPFSTDAWTPIRNTELLLEHTPIHLGDNQIFDGYNNFWPGNTLFGAAFSLIVGVEPLAALRLGIPSSGALTILIFFILVRKITGKVGLAFIASVLLATIFPYSLFTGGVTKETFANPLYLLCILLSRTSYDEGVGRKVLLFTLSSAALVLAHHLTAFVTIVVLVSTALAEAILKVKNGSTVDRRSFLPVSILTAVTGLYWALYAWRGFNVTLTLTDCLSAASYQLVAFSLALYFTMRGSAHSRVKTFLSCFSSAVLVFLLALLCTERAIIPGAPQLPSRYLIYATPFILASPLTVHGFRSLRKEESDASPNFWLAAILGLEFYAVFGDPPSAFALAYRTLDFLCVPLAILCAAGLYRLYQGSRSSHSGIVVKVLPVFCLILLAALNSYNVYAAVSLEERYMGYFWLYTCAEYRGAAWTSKALKGQLVAGDVKAAYLLNGYFDHQVDPYLGFRYMSGEAPEPPNLFTYNQMMKNGYVVHGGYSLDLPEDWMEKTSDLDKVYANGNVNIYHGEEDS